MIRPNKSNCRGVIVTAKANPPYDFISRYFSLQLNGQEDPVTGSAHCLLADYWHDKLGKSEFKAFQASKRGGELGVKIYGGRVLLTGKAIMILKGIFYG